MFTSQWVLGLSDSMLTWCDAARLNVTTDVLLCFPSELVKEKGTTLPRFQIPGPLSPPESLPCTLMHTQSTLLSKQTAEELFKNTAVCQLHNALSVQRFFFPSCYITLQILYYSEALTC